MAGLRDRLEELHQEAMLRWPDERARALNEPGDSTGHAAVGAAYSLVFLGVAEFVLHGDVTSFRSRLAEAARLTCRLFERAEGGAAISDSYLTLLCYREMLVALAAGEFELARALAGHMNRRPAAEQKQIHTFDRAFGAALNALVLDTPDARELVDAFVAICGQKQNRSLAPLGAWLDAGLRNDLPGVQQAMAAWLKGHRRLAGNGIFANTPQEVLSLWGLGLVNFFRHRGLPVTADHPLIPAVLVT